MSERVSRFPERSAKRGLANVAVWSGAMALAGGLLVGCDRQPDCASPATVSPVYSQYHPASNKGGDVSWDRGVEIDRPTELGLNGNDSDVGYEGMVIGRKINDGPWQYTSEISIPDDTHVFAQADPHDKTQFSVQFLSKPQQPAGFGTCYTKPSIKFPNELINRVTLDPDLGFTMANFTLSDVPTPVD